MNDSSEFDPRPAYRAATDWVAGLMAAVRDDQLGAPTPCPDFDVRVLMGHLVATGMRAEAIGHGRDPNLEPRIVDTDRPADDYRTVTGRAQVVWADDATLDVPATVPWGTVPGRAALAGYVRESLVHGWDLAVATGQPAEADPELVLPLLETTKEFLPADMRGEGIPFGPVVEPRPEAGPTEQLANWTGRPNSGWA